MLNERPEPIASALRGMVIDCEPKLYEARALSRMIDKHPL